MIDELPLIFATVGTDVHPFHRMTRWIDGWLEQGGSQRAQCFMQTGTSEEPRLASHYPYLGYTEMEQKVREATAVVCHGGPGTIMLCLALGKQPIVVPRAAERGEHVDDHQRAFSKRVAADGVILLAETEDEFRQHMELVLDGGATGAMAHLNGRDPSATAARFEELVNGLFSGADRSAQGSPVARGRRV